MGFAGRVLQSRDYLFVQAAMMFLGTFFQFACKSAGMFLTVTVGIGETVTVPFWLSTCATQQANKDCSERVEPPSMPPLTYGVPRTTHSSVQNARSSCLSTAFNRGYLSSAAARVKPA